MRRRLLTFALILLPALAAAQQPVPPAPGDVLRIHRPSGGEPARVTLLRVTRDSLIAHGAKARDTVRVALRDVSRLEIRTGTRSRWLLGGALGGGAGLVGGALIGGAATEADADVQLGGAILGGVVGLGAGGMIGAIIGSQLRTDLWAPLELERVRLIAAREGGFGVELSWRF